MTIRPNLNNTSSTGGAGTNGLISRGGSARVSIPTKMPFRRDMYPYPYPAESNQGSIGGSGMAQNTVTRPKDPYYGPFSQQYWGNWPWKVNRQGWLSGWSLPCRE